MEELYNPSSFNATEPMQLQEYFKKYGKACYGSIKCIVKEDNNKAIMKELNVGDDISILNKLEEACSIDLLDDESIPYKPVDIPDRLTSKHKLKEFYPLTSKALQLECVKYREEVLKYFRSKYKDIERIFFSTNVFSLVNLNTSTSDDIKEINSTSEYIIKILVYKPVSLNRGMNNSEKVRFAQEIEVLGSNTLTEFADKIDCLTDFGLYKEVETTEENLSNFVNGKVHYPSGSLFIENVFYYDLRCQNAIDYSEPIQLWARDKRIERFQTKIMDSTKFNDLKPRLGHPYVYLHQGDCEHIISFSDAKLVQNCDVLDKKCYPRITVNKRKCNTQCYLCTFDYAKWIVIDSDRVPQEKIFLCTECCNSYHFIDGKKVRDFKLYPLYDRRMLGQDDESEDEAD